jgi:hypothetical protein
MKLKEFLLKSVPYILSVFGGVVVYVMSVDLVHDANLNGLFSNVAASLLAIPLIFVLYDYINWKMSRELHDKMSESLIFDVNSIMLKVIKELRGILKPGQKLTWKLIEQMLRMRSSEIRKNAKIHAEDIATLNTHKKNLNELSYKLLRSGVLHDRQIQQVIAITKQLAHVVNEYEYIGGTPRLAKHFESLLGAIDDWFDSLERESLTSHQQFQLSIEQENK